MVSEGWIQPYLPFHSTTSPVTAASLSLVLGRLGPLGPFLPLPLPLPSLPLPKPLLLPSLPNLPPFPASHPLPQASLPIL